MELLYLLKILYRRKWILIFCTLISVLAAFFLTLDDPKLYKSVSQLSTGFTVSEDIKMSNETFNIPQIDAKFNNAIENITSSKVVALMSYNLLLHDLNSGKPFRRISNKDLKNNPDLINIDKPLVTQLLHNKIDSFALLNTVHQNEKLLEKLLNAYNYDIDNLKKNLSVGRFQRTDYINIVYKSENPELSAYVVNALIIEFRRYFDSFRKERSSESIVTLDSLAKKRKLELDQKIAMKTQFQSDSAVLSPELVNSTNLEQVNLIESSLADERGKAQSYSYQITQLEKQIANTQGNNNPGPAVNNVSGNEEYMALRKQRSEVYGDFVRKGGNDPVLKKQLDDLDEKLKEKIPASVVKNNSSVDNQANLTNNLIQKKIEIEGQLQSSESKITYYSSRLKALRGGMGNMVSMGATLQQLEKEIEILNNEYTAIKEKLDLAMNLTDAGRSNFKQTLYGQPALEHEPSKRILIITLAGLAAFILTFLVLMFFEYIDQSIKSPSQFNRQTGLKLLGVVNSIPLKGHKISEKFMQLGNPEEGNRKDSFRELLRKIRFELENSKKQIFLFTSTEPQQGKTTLIQALAFSLSLGKKKVLILDTNFCNNDITVMNAAQPTLEKFSGNGHLVNADEIAAMVTPTGITNVDIIGCHGGDYTPSEILPRNHLLNYLKDLLTVYDFIFMEGAPLNGFADTKELVKYADGVVAIFSATTEIKQTDIASITFLKTLDKKFLGAILNKVENLNINN